MSCEYSITKAQESDVKEILSLQYAAYQSEAILYNDFSIQPLTQTAEQALAEFRKCFVLKAVSKGKIIGSIRAYEKRGTAYVGKLMVHPDFQNQGIGKRLLQAIDSEFPGRRFELFTGAKSEKNIALYEKCGYTRFKTEEAATGPTFVYLEKHAVQVREIVAAEYPLLEDFLYYAIFVPPGADTPPREVIFQPEIFVYIDGFGDKPSDCGVVAESDGKIVGAAWTRIIPAFGHVDDDTPELAISVMPDYRGHGIGTALMTRLFELLRERGYKRTSLSVQKANPAARLYKRLGYEIILENIEDWIMIKSLQKRTE